MNSGLTAVNSAIFTFSAFQLFGPKLGQGEWRPRDTLKRAFGVVMRARQESGERFVQWRVDSCFSGILIALTCGERLERARPL